MCFIVEPVSFSQYPFRQVYLVFNRLTWIWSVSWSMSSVVFLSVLYQNHRSVIGLKLRRLQDLNEITSHILEVVQAHMRNRRAPLNKAWLSCQLWYLNQSVLHGNTWKWAFSRLDLSLAFFIYTNNYTYKFIKLSEFLSVCLFVLSLPSGEWNNTEF